MTFSSEDGSSRGGGSILVVGGASSEFLPAVQALQSMADTTLVPPAEALAALSRLDANVLVVEDRDRQLLAEAVALRPAIVRILLRSTGQATGEAADGAADGPDAETVVLPRPLDVAALQAVCAVALRCGNARRQARDLESENHRLRGVGTETASFTPEELGELERYEGILTQSSAMRRVLALLRKIEGTDTTALIHGETGTGKELVAQAIHARSRSRRGRFVAVNLGAISDHLRESELFGHVRGAFTGATENRGGLFVEANGGCIFLDEVGDASPGLQVALLRVLEEGIITPVGSDRPRRVDVHVISGTNRNLDELVRQGLFRRDLYYRLNVFPIELPPLRHRPEDIFPLAKHFVVQASLAMGKKPPEIAREARAVLDAYHWEGNVRELRNVMERAAILCKGGAVVAADLPLALERGHGSVPTGDAASTIVIPPGGAKLNQLEREIFEKTLALAGYNQSRAARILGLRESTFRFRLQKLGIASRRSLPFPLGRVATFIITALTALAEIALSS